MPGYRLEMRTVALLACLDDYGAMSSSVGQSESAEMRACDLRARALESYGEQGPLATFEALLQSHYHVTYPTGQAVKADCNEPVRALVSLTSGCQFERNHHVKTL